MLLGSGQSHWIPVPNYGALIANHNPLTKTSTRLCFTKQGPNIPTEIQMAGLLPIWSLSDKYSKWAWATEQFYIISIGRQLVQGHD